MATVLMQLTMLLRLWSNIVAHGESGMNSKYGIR